MRISAPAAALLALAALGCGEAPDPVPPRLVVLYAPCTVNADFLSPYDPSVAFTPEIGRFASESVVFENHYTEAGQSGIAYAALLTGFQADHHGIFRHPVKLHPDLRLITEVYADAGFETFAWLAHPMASPKLGYAQGVTRANARPRRLDAGDPVFAEILERLAADPEYKAFVVTNLYVTHTPYGDTHLAEFTERYAPDEALANLGRYARLHRKQFFPLTWNRDATFERLVPTDEQREALVNATELLYASNVMELDRLFGAVVEAIASRSLESESLVAFTADHGELLYRENAPFSWAHAMTLAPEVLRVPLIIRGAGLRPRRYEGVTRSIDVMPTLLGLSGVDLPEGQTTAGVDLSPALRGEAPPPELTARSHTTVLVRSVYQRMMDPRHAQKWARVRELFPSEDPALMWASLRRGDLFFQLTGRGGQDWRVEAFDIRRDPGVSRDIFDAGNPEHARAAEELAAYKRHLVERYDAAGEGRKLLPPDREQDALQSLGYIE